jgi:PAS domain S-box-containing protein
MYFERLQNSVSNMLAALRQSTELFPDDESLAPSFRAKQLQVMLRVSPLTMLANLMNAALVIVTFWDSANRGWLLGWGLLIAMAAMQGLRARGRPQRPRASRRAIRRATIHAGLLALLWSLMMAYLFPSANAQQQFLIAVLVSGMMSAGGLALATLPMAGTAWVVVLCLGSFACILQGDFPLAIHVSLLLLIYSATMLSSVWSTARSFTLRLVAEATSEKQNQVIGLLLRDFEENASDILWEIDAAGYLTHIPPRLEQVLGVSASELTRKPALELLAGLQQSLPKAEQTQLPALQHLLTQAVPIRDMIIPVFSSDQRMWWSLSAKPLQDASGALLGWRGVASNVTERMQAAEAMRTHNERLEVLVKERTTHLNQALSAAEAANRAKSLFLSSMSHELRTPLNAVLGYSQLMGMNTQASKETREAATEIQNAGSHLLALVNDVLDLARIESGKLEMNIERVDLAQVLEESRRTLDSLAQSRRVTLVIPALQHHVLADPVRLRQVMFNLISNAIKYNCDAGRVTVQGEIRPGRRYRITVSDTGIGIPADRMGELFQPFNRMGAERGSVEGTGIGLVITKTLIESMNGSIGVDSAFGAGSAFWVELPLAEG